MIRASALLLMAFAVLLTITFVSGMQTSVKGDSVVPEKNGMSKYDLDEFTLSDDLAVRDDDSDDGGRGKKKRGRKRRCRCRRTCRCKGRRGRGNGSDSDSD